MTARLSGEEVLDVLHEIDRREVTLTADEDPAYVYAGNVTYQASNGWVLVVFNDCGEWDYLDHATSEDGREWDFDDDKGYGPACSYRGPEGRAECYRVWGIPGYLNGRGPGGHVWTQTLPPEFEVRFDSP